MISIVDDDEAVREAMVQLIRSLGHAAAAFESAEEFLESDQVGSTSCLISDVQMPGLGGVELQQRLLALGYRMPIIFITAFPDERIRARVLDAGAIGYLNKPCEEDVLIGCLDAALTGSPGSPAS
jgi:FixJ family two-component response regulator